jgi:biotin carboxyl carrier protein
MKLQAEIEGNLHDVDLRRDGERVFAVVDDRTYELEYSEPEPGVLLFKHDGKVVEAFVSRSSDMSGETIVDLRGQRFTIDLIDPKRLRGSAADHSHGDAVAEIKTAMPGKVVRILVKLGDQVEKGAHIIVVEAMKMQNEMRSPKEGAISEIRVAEGATVEAGQVLVVVE